MRLEKGLIRNAILLLCLVSIVVFAADTAFAQDGETNDLKPLGAGLAVGIAGLGSSIGMGMAGSAAIGAITEKPEVFGKAFLFIVLIEAVAIYGLLVAILLVL